MGNILMTAEVRWFFEGTVPAAIEQWVCSGTLLSRAAPREDHYVLFPASLGLNVKLREGRLEIKTLAQALGARSFAADVAGHVQLWEKRLGEDPAVREFERLRASAPHLWIAVRKERTLRKFSLDGDSIQELDAGKVFLSEGCNIELTRIVVEGTAFWSFNFEAYGDQSRVEAHLQRVAGHVLADPRRPPHPFPTANSRSYPEWLGIVKKQA